MIREHVKLLFDPENAQPITQEVFADDMARTIWLAIKQGHLAGPRFGENVLKASKWVRKLVDEDRLTVEKLFDALTHEVMLLGSSEQDFAEELLPFVLGEKSISYEVIKEDG